VAPALRPFCTRILRFLTAREHARLHELRPRELEERRVGLRGARPRDQRLARARRPVQQHALGWLDADVVEAVLVLDRQHDRLAQLLDLLVEAADVAVVLRRLLIDLRRDASGAFARVPACRWCKAGAPDRPSSIAVRRDAPR
jgi:hypothetical protein